jgi:hypothetical protein
MINGFYDRLAGVLEMIWMGCFDAYKVFLDERERGERKYPTHTLVKEHYHCHC